MTRTDLLLGGALLAMVAAAIGVFVYKTETRCGQSTSGYIQVLDMACEIYKIDSPAAYPPVTPYVGSQNLRFYLGSPRGDRPPIVEFKRHQVSDDGFLIDRWGRPIGYANPGVHNTRGIDIWSTGKDPADPADDIGNWPRDF